MNWPGPEPAYRFVVGSVLTIFKIMNWDVRVTGAEHIPTSGAAIIASNHVSYTDFIFIGYGARERGRLIRFMAKLETFEHWLTGPLMRGSKHIPVDRFGDSSRPIAECVRRLEQGQIVGMFPESTISPSFVPRRGKTGTARIALGSGVPIIPCAVWGSQRTITKWRPKNFQRGLAIDVRFGPPVPYEVDEDPRAVTDRLMAAITDLVDRAARDYPQRPTGPADSWWLPAHLGGSAPTPEDAEERLVEERARKRAHRERRRRRD